MDPKVIFTVPAHVAGIARAVAEYSGEIEGDLPDDAVQAATMLHKFEGRMIEVVFPAPVDPGEARRNASRTSPRSWTALPTST